MNEKLEKINRELERSEAKLCRAEDEVKILEHQMKQLTRKERTHRLCTRGAMVESYFPAPEAMTDEQIKMILNVMFHRSDTKHLIDTVLAENHKKE